MLIAIGLTGAAGLWAFVVLLRQLYYICQPSEVLIFAGLRRNTGSGQRVGYRTVRGGSALRIPLLEDVMRLDLSNMIIDLRVDNAYRVAVFPRTFPAWQTSRFPAMNQGSITPSSA